MPRTLCPKLNRKSLSLGENRRTKVSPRRSSLIGMKLSFTSGKKSHGLAPKTEQECHPLWAEAPSFSLTVVVGKQSSQVFICWLATSPRRACQATRLVPARLSRCIKANAASLRFSLSQHDSSDRRPRASCFRHSFVIRPSRAEKMAVTFLLRLPHPRDEDIRA